MLVLARDVHDIDAENFPSRGYDISLCTYNHVLSSSEEVRLTVTRHAREGDVEVHDKLFAPCPIHQDRRLLYGRADT